MKRSVCKIRPSPNEEARLIREEIQRRRKLRIQQVREQQRHVARQIRQNVEHKRQLALRELEEQLRENWERQHSEQLRALESLYQQSLQSVGQGHRSAKENEPDLAAIAQKEEENRVKAEQRYREALKELKSQKFKDHEKQSQAINARNKALQAEKERSATVASLPPPPPNPIQNIDLGRPRVGKRADIRAFASTYHHMLGTAVDREADKAEQTCRQPTAIEEAELENERLQELQREEMRKKEEQMEKARLRGKQALRKEQLLLDRERFLAEVEHMKQTDLLRRRQQAPQMPPQTLQPICKRQEAREDFQRELEFAFEDMLLGERNIKGDLVVQLVPEPLSVPSVSGQEQELDVTLDDHHTPETANARPDAEQEAAVPEPEASSKVEAPKPAHRGALMKLLHRIRKQRKSQGICVPAADSPASDSPPAGAGHAPERDTSIDTGSLASEERARPPSSELAAPVRRSSALAPVMELEEPSTTAETLPTDASASGAQELEEEQKKKELERQTQQQIDLLQELEEQRAKLEEMLLEAQQERERLRAAVMQEVPKGQPEAPVHDQEVTHSPKLVPPVSESEHTRRIREHQQKLLERDRIHQQSVEVARQRLQEYQRALLIRYNIAQSLPPVAPQGLERPPPHGALDARPPSPPPADACAKRQTAAEAPTRERGASASPRRLSGSGSSVPPGEVESIPGNPRSQIQDVSAWLTGSIAERVTEHLPKRLRPTSITAEPLPYEPFPTHHSANGVSPRRASDPEQDDSLSGTDDGRLAPGQATVKKGILSHGFPHGSLREDDLERQRRELQEVERQRRELQEVEWQRRELQEMERQRRELQEMERQQRELQEMERQQRELQEMERQQRELQEMERERWKLQEVERERLKLQEREKERLKLQEKERLKHQEQERQRLDPLEVEMHRLDPLEVKMERLDLLEVERRRLELLEVERRRLELQELERRRLVLQEVERRRLVLREMERERLKLQEVERQRRELQEMAMQRRERQDVERHRVDPHEVATQRLDLQEMETQTLDLQEMETQTLDLQEMETQTLDLQEVEMQRRDLQEVERLKLILREVENRRLELQEAESRRLELQEVETEGLELQEVDRRILEHQEMDSQRRELQEMERQRRELQEVQRVPEQEVQMMLQKETLQALIANDAQPPSEVPGASENIGQTRRKLLASLLKAIERSNGGTLSFLEDPREKDGSPQPSARGQPHPPRAAKPPVARVRSGIMETKQHELSAIQEAEASFSGSQVAGLEGGARMPARPAAWDPREDGDSSAALSVSSSGQRATDRASGSGTSSRTSEQVTWREKLLATEFAEPGSVHRVVSPLSSDSGRGADYSPAAVYRSLTEESRQAGDGHTLSAHGPPDSDCLSTTLSTGSYITTDAAANLNSDRSSTPGERQQDQGVDSLDLSTHFSQSSCMTNDSPASCHSLAVGALFNDNSIQRIIDRYTRELNISLSTAGKTTDSEASFAVETCSPVSRQSLDPRSAGRQSPPTDSAGTPSSCLEWDNRANQILEPFLHAENQEQDSFTPLIGQFAEQSSCVAADQTHPAMEQLVGLPSAHSSMIGQLAAAPASASAAPAGWDSTLSHMIGWLSHHSGSHWLSGGQDFYAGQLLPRAEAERSSAWFDESPEGSRMRPLVGEPDESAGHQIGSPGERISVDSDVPAEALAPSYPSLPPEASPPHSASVRDADPHLQAQASSPDLGQERTEGSDSFHQLMPEVTQNETADASMTFHPPEHGTPTPPESWPPSVESPERFRTDEPLRQLVSPQCLTPAAALDLELTPTSPAALTMRDATAGASGGGDADDDCAAKWRDTPIPFIDLPAALQSVQSLTSGSATPASDETAVGSRFLEPSGASGRSRWPDGRLPLVKQDFASKKGILEQSEITLVSIADTTLQDRDTTASEEEGAREGPHAEGSREEGRPGCGNEESDCTSGTLTEDKDQTPPATLLEIEWGSGPGLQERHQHRRTALLQRSSRRVEEIKARGAFVRASPDAEGKTGCRPQRRTDAKSKAGKAEQPREQTTAKLGFTKQNRTQLPPPGRVSGPTTADEVKMSDPEQRRLAAAEMHKRTQRLYERLEEVEQRRAIRSRQEAYSKNRMKAKEFHKKTLQKLRAKQTH